MNRLKQAWLALCGANESHPIVVAMSAELKALEAHSAWQGGRIRFLEQKLADVAIQPKPKVAKGKRKA